eukprot:13511310-Ditylum_brightwellii.AAC.1
MAVFFSFLFSSSSTQQPTITTKRMNGLTVMISDKNPKYNNTKNFKGSSFELSKIKQEGPLFILLRSSSFTQQPTVIAATMNGLMTLMMLLQDSNKNPNYNDVNNFKDYSLELSKLRREGPLFSLLRSSFSTQQPAVMATAMNGLTTL